ncbi:MAG TPA: transglycosylase domain-containing protein, partial [Bdellovibrionales bacterium]|nr:transglycosylase domain-containing protein [Bdellovibrionales bacterium]
MKPLVQWSLVGLASWLCLSLIWEIRQTPSFNDVRTGPPGADRAILDRHGRVLDEVRAGSGQRRLNWTPLNETTADFRSALLLAQDRRFYFHPGIDLLAWGRATLTMQLSDLLRPEPALGAGVILRAIALEMKWSKAQILEAFVNLAPYRQELRGVSVASYALFDKAPPRLTRGESAVIAALANQPERLVAAV